MEEKSAFDEFDIQTRITRRRNLLPIWIKMFVWLFFFGGGIGFIILIFGLFSNNIKLSLYGFETTKVYSLKGLVITSLLIFKGIVSYGLWFEKDWAIKIGKFDAVLGVIICIISMIVMPFFTKHFELRLEVAVLIPFLMKLENIEKDWQRL